MGKKGQALIEFVLILPIMLLLFIGMFDIGNLFIHKYQMLHDLDNIIEHQVKPSSNYQLIIKEEEDYTKYTLIQKMTIFTPGVNLAFKEGAKLTISREVYEP